MYTQLQCHSARIETWTFRQSECPLVKVSDGAWSLCGGACGPVTCTVGWCCCHNNFTIWFQWPWWRADSCWSGWRVSAVCCVKTHEATFRMFPYQVSVIKYLHKIISRYVCACVRDQPVDNLGVAIRRQVWIRPLTPEVIIHLITHLFVL